MCFAAEESSDRVQPTAAEQMAFKQIDAQSNVEIRLATAARPAVKKEKASKRLLQKIVKPIEATWSELTHPMEIVKFAQRLLHADSPMATWADNFAERPLSSRFLGVGVIRSPEFSVASAAPSGSTRFDGMSLNRYVEMPRLNDTFESSVTQHTATQLQVRMRRDWTMLYEVNRTNSAIYRDEIGVGLGVRHSF
jgi:hypothetical protein